jgi:hypothetical protein
MSTYQGENTAHKAVVQVAEGQRQSAVAAAGFSQSAAVTAEISFYRTCRTSALANAVSPTIYIDALRSLGSGGA